MGRSRAALAIVVGMTLLPLAGCAQTQLAAHVAGVVRPEPPQGHYKIGRPYQVNGVWHHPREDYAYDETGIASWYGPGFDQRLTANGERFDQDALTAAHPTLQLPALVRVTNLENGRSVVLRVNDRGPFVNGRLIDVSRRGAELLGFRQRGTARVRVQVLAEESRQVAELARQGRGGAATPVAPGAAVTTVALGGPASAADRSPGAAGRSTVTLPDGDVAPRPVVVQGAVAPTSIFVQAGAFAVYDNAAGLSARLASVGPTEVTPAVVGGTRFYRVRLGPLASVEDADRVLGAVIARGQTGARIVVD